MARRSKCSAVAATKTDPRMKATAATLEKTSIAHACHVRPPSPCVLSLFPEKRPPTTVAIQASVVDQCTVPQLASALSASHGANTLVTLIARKPTPEIPIHDPNRVHHSRRQSWD